MSTSPARIISWRRLGADAFLSALEGRSIRGGCMDFNAAKMEFEASYTIADLWDMAQS